MTELKVPVITVDGPVGSGKGTIALLLAKELGWNLLDSGALYRVLALQVAQKNVALSDVAEISKLAINLDVIFMPQDYAGKVIFNGQDVSGELRTEKCAKLASQVAAIQQVRQALLTKQRHFQQPPGLVADGRDMGTVVFPAAELKFFLDASLTERIKRRYLQLQEKGIDVNLAQLEKEIVERDARDRNREHSPLKPADDAIIIDSTSFGVAEIFSKIMDLVRGKLKVNA